MNHFVEAETKPLREALDRGEISQEEFEDTVLKYKKKMRLKFSGKITQTPIKDHPYNRITFYKDEYWLEKSKHHQTTYTMINPLGVLFYTPKQPKFKTGKLTHIQNQSKNPLNHSIFEHLTIAQQNNNLKRAETIDDNHNNLTLTNDRFKEIVVRIIEGNINAIEFIEHNNEKRIIYYSNYKAVENYPFLLPHKIKTEKYETDKHGYQFIQTIKTYDIVKYDLNCGITPEDCVVQIPDDVLIVKMN